jgi:adenylosuccinate lyase
LNAISPIDGRYRNKTISLAPFFSEEALIKYRVLVEIEYFIAVRVPLPQLGSTFSLFESLRNIYKNFSTKMLWIKETEKVTNHDVKPWNTLSKMLLKN